MNLLVSSLWGGLYLVILFLLCFALVAGVKYARLQAARKKRTQKTEKEAPEKAPEKKEVREPRPVYYLVEKKTRKTPEDQLRRTEKDPLRISCTEIPHSRYTEPKRSDSNSRRAECAAARGQSL